MRHAPRLSALAAALSLLAGPGAQAQQAPAAEAQRVEVFAKKGDASKWVRAESDHLVVYSDVREEDVTRLMDNLEKLDQLLRVYTVAARPAEPQAQEPKLTLYFHARLADLGEIDSGMPADAIGLYSSCASAAQGFAVHLERIPGLRDEQLEKSPLNDTLSSAFEAYARHFLYRHTDIRTPAWFIEGFAQYFSSVRFSEAQMVVGRIPKPIGDYLRFIDSGHKYSLDDVDVLENRVADAHNYAGDAGVQLEFQAKSWLLTHYALSSDDRRKRLSRYLALVGRGVGPTLAFERAFGLKKADISKVMWRYGRGVQVLRVARPAAPAVQVGVRSLPRAADELLVADAALKACPSRQAGERLLQQVAAAAARFPNDDLARLAASRAQIGWGDPQAAVPALSSMLQRNDGNAEAQQLMGLAQLRLAERSDGAEKREHVQAARRHLERARSLDPRSVEAAIASFEAEVAAGDEPGSAALQGAIAAWQGAREVDALARAAALAYAYAGNGDAAHETLDSLVQNPRNAPMAQWAKQWQGRLEAGVSRRDILAEMRRPPVAGTPFMEWTIDKARVMQKVTLAQGLEAAQSIIKDMQRDKPDPAANGARGGTQSRQ